MSFNTIEDVNTAIFNYGVSGFIHCCKTADINIDTDFSNVKYDFFTVSRVKNGTDYTFTFKVDNNLWIGSYYFRTGEGEYIENNATYSNDVVTFTSSNKNVEFYVYLTVLHNWEQFWRFSRIPVPFDLSREATLDNIDKWEYTRYLNLISNTESVGTQIHYNKGIFNWGFSRYHFYYIGRLIKTDLVFDCSQDLTVGIVNTVRLGVDDDYLPNGSLVGEYTPVITVQYGNESIEAYYDSTLNDYCFDLDLTDKTTEGKIRFKVQVATNEVLNASETDVSLDSTFETINTLAKLKTLFLNGGVGRLGSNLSLSSDLTPSKSVYLIGNDRTLNLNGHKIVVNENLTFKVSNLTFTNGENTIQQNTGSNVELNNCNFTDCTGMGSVIDCQVDIASLENTDDFNTKLTDCTITDCDMAILHGGNLEVTGCTVTGKVGDKHYPYFLYQTNGNATLLTNQFSLTSDEQIDTDLEFNTCIFVCGENAQVNGLDYTELQKNNIQSFLATQRNTSVIDVTYYYPSIEGYVTLQSNNGYCHSVSSVDFVFKTNIELSRGD